MLYPNNVYKSLQSSILNTNENDDDDDNSKFHHKSVEKLVYVDSNNNHNNDKCKALWNSNHCENHVIFYSKNTSQHKFFNNISHLQNQSNTESLNSLSPSYIVPLFSSHIVYDNHTNLVDNVHGTAVVATTYTTNIITNCSGNHSYFNSPFNFVAVREDRMRGGRSRRGRSSYCVVTTPNSSNSNNNNNDSKMDNIKCLLSSNSVMYSKSVDSELYSSITPPPLSHTSTIHVNNIHPSNSGIDTSNNITTSVPYDKDYCNRRSPIIVPSLCTVSKTICEANLVPSSLSLTNSVPQVTTTCTTTVTVSPSHSSLLYESNLFNPN